MRAERAVDWSRGMWVGFGLDQPTASVAACLSNMPESLMKFNRKMYFGRNFFFLLA
jgi:hypothetical protein